MDCQGNIEGSMKLNTELLIQLNIHLHARYVVPIVKHIMTVKQNTVNGTTMIEPRHEKT